MGVAVFGGQIQAPCEPLWGAAVGKAASFFSLPYSLLPGRVLSRRLALMLLHVVLKAERTLARYRCCNVAALPTALPTVVVSAM